MFGRKPYHPSDARGDQRSDFVKNALTASTLVSLGLLILIAPDFYRHTSDFVWRFLQQRYPAQLLPIAFFALYAVAYPAMFFLARASWTTSAGMAVLWIADRLI